MLIKLHSEYPIKWSVPIEDVLLFNDCYVYSATWDFERFYVGSSTMIPLLRIREHLTMRDKQAPFKNRIREFGPPNEWEIRWSGPESKRFTMEQFWIDKLNSVLAGFNYHEA